jgi:hypothetical protein
LFVGDDRSTSPSLQEVLPALTGPGMPVFDTATLLAAGQAVCGAYDAFIISS